MNTARQDNTQADKSPADSTRHEAARQASARRVEARGRRPVVVGMDGSDTGRVAVEYAAALAVRRDLPLHLVHAFEPTQYEVRPTIGWRPDASGVMRSAAQRLIDQTVEVLGLAYPNLPVTARLEAGSAEVALIEESRRASTLVVGARGTGGFAALVVGSTTLHVASHAHCPVIAVPTPSDCEPPRHGVVVGVDGSALSDDAIAFAFEVAEETKQPLLAVHAWSDPTRTGVGSMMPLVYDPLVVSQEEQLVLAESMAGWADKHPDVVVTNRVVHAHPVQALAAESATAQLLVVGSHGRGDLRSLLLGSVGHGLLHHATAPVAIVRRERV
jgi:nucleotide-binding universal stress UspA family protein